MISLSATLLLLLIGLGSAMPIKFMTPNPSADLYHIVEELVNTSSVFVDYRDHTAEISVHELPFNDEMDAYHSFLLYHHFSKDYGFRLSRVWYENLTDNGGLQHIIIRAIITPYQGLPPLRH